LGTAAATASADEATAKPDDELDSTAFAEIDGRSGTYRGRVTHVGEHVLVVVDAGQQPARQFVFDRNELPVVEEGESVSVWLYRGEVIHVW
jgi:hypothetical protein